MSQPGLECLRFDRPVVEAFASIATAVSVMVRVAFSSCRVETKIEAWAINTSINRCREVSSSYYI